MTIKTRRNTRMTNKDEKMQINDEQLKTVSGGIGDETHTYELGRCFREYTEYCNSRIINYYKIISLLPAKETYECRHWTFIEKSSSSSGPSGKECLTLEYLKKCSNLGMSLPDRCEGQ